MKKLFFIILLFISTCYISAATFKSDWENTVDRVWIGQQYWSNPLQDWRIYNGNLECITSAPNRNIHLLTHQLSSSTGSFQMSVKIKLLDETANGKIGFRIGARGKLDDYRDSIFKGKGIDFDVNPSKNKFKLILTANFNNGKYSICLKKINLKINKEIVILVTNDIPKEKLVGNIALITDVSCRFSNWEVSGSKITSKENQVFGPILFVQYTLSENILKLTSQMPPVGKKDSQVVELEINENKKWKKIAKAKIDKFSRTANFQIKNWESFKDVPYRLVYFMGKKNYFYTGKIRRNPIDKGTIIVAGFTGNKDFAFPNNDLVQNVKIHNPDLLFFAGDQIYESCGGYGFIRKPFETACLDYLRKWYMFGWAFRDLMCNRPTVTIPDDHDVYQFNLWGAAGRKTEKDDKGGFIMQPEFVNMVQRTQSSHLPAAYESKPVKQNIEVYYTSLNYGRISFAIIEDRKFKSGPNGIVPKTFSGRADHVISTNFNPKTADVAGAKLLGERQLDFLRTWVSDWRNADMKVLLSQTIFGNVANLHGSEKLRLVADYDSNGWPQTGRNKALAELRKGFVFHIAGDQHLATIVHHGIDDWNDSGYSFCVPSIAAGYPRSWLPLSENKDKKAAGTDYTGKFFDGFGNHITVLAAANPEKTLGAVDTVAALRAKASGYGIIKLNKKEEKIIMECWPLNENPESSSAKQFSDWPQTIKVQDNYGRKAKAFLPTIELAGITNPVFQIINEKDNEIVYTIREKQKKIRLKVFEEGIYTIKIGDPDNNKLKIFKNIQTLGLFESEKIIKINF